MGRNNLVVHFLKGSRRLNPPRPVTVPTWDLPTVLRALKSPAFEPLQSVDLRPLTLKTALLLALALVNRMGDQQVLSVSPSCLEFGPNDSMIILKPRHRYIPKVLSNLERLLSWHFVLQSTARVWIYSALSGCWEFILSVPAPFRQSEQLFLCFGGHTKGSPVTKQRLSRWIIDAIKLASSHLSQLWPMGVRAHSTRGIASFWAWAYSVTNITLVPWDTERVLRTLPCYLAARLSRCFSRSNLRSLDECPHYIARCPTHSGGLWRAFQP